MNSSIILLTDLSHEIGLIGVAEYVERMKIAEWLSELGDGVRDPRLNNGEEGQCSEREDPIEPQKTGDDARSRDSLEKVNDESPYMQFLAISTWMFTVGDRDCYPSVPHGHFKRKTNEWPKLNPYVGRVFSSMHTEDVSARLTRAEMKALWSDEGFVDHCRYQVLWYSDFAPRYTFPSARRGRLVFPKWL